MKEILVIVCARLNEEYLLNEKKTNIENHATTCNMMVYAPSHTAYVEIAIEKRIQRALVRKYFLVL